MNEPQSYMGLAVQATDGEAGRVNDVLLDAQSGRVHGLVVQGHGFFGSDVVVLAAAISGIDGGRVMVGLSREEVGRLPVYSAAQYGAAQGLVSVTAQRFDQQTENEQGL